MENLTDKIATPLLTILKQNKVAIRTRFYDLDEKQIYIENDLFNEMVYVRFIGIETPFLPALSCNINKINIHCLADWIDQIFKVISFHKQKKDLEVAQKIQDDIKNHIPQFFKRS